MLSQGKGGIQDVGEVIAMGPLGPFMTQRDLSGMVLKSLSVRSNPDGIRFS